jgi:transposase-like protein
MALRDYKADEVAQALRDADGIVSEAARILGCARSTIYRAMDEYVTVKEAREEAQASAVDTAERKLMDLVEQGDFKAVRMLLRTQRPDKWNPKQKVEHSGDGFQVNIHPPDED